MARSMSLSVILLVVLAVSLPTSDGVRFTVSPSHTVTEWINHIVSFYCRPDVVNHGVSYVSQLKLEKYVGGHWQTVAKFNRKNRAVKDPKYAKHIQMAGQITRNVKDSYLLVNIVSPTPADTGTYRCNIYLVATNGFIGSDKSSIRVTVKKDTSGGVIG